MKSIHKPEYQLFCALLRETRTNAGLSQIALAAALGLPQAYVSAFELGKVRQDFIQLRDWCSACGITVGQLADMFDARWKAEQAATSPTAKKASAAGSKTPGAASKPVAKGAAKSAVRKRPSSA